MSICAGGCIAIPVAINEITSQISNKNSQKVAQNWQPEKFKQLLRVPPILQPTSSDATKDYYEITLAKANVEIIPGLTTEIWGYNGISPGPTIRQTNKSTVIRFINKLDRDSQGKNIDAVVHIHGMASPPQYDGYAMDFIPPNYYKDYLYRGDRASTLWYHDHTMDATWRNVYMGLLGMYIIQDDLELSLSLPKEEYDIPIILEDKKFTANGSLIFNDNRQKGIYNNNFITLVNGMIWPKMSVENRLYRFRLLNASGNRYHNLALSKDLQNLTPEEELIIIGNDGGLIDQPIRLKSSEQFLRIAMAERYEIIIDFSQYTLGTQLYLHDAKNVNGKLILEPLMRFDVNEISPYRDSLPNKLRPIETVEISQAKKTRTFKYEKQDNKWKINNKTWDMHRIDANPNLGDVEIWNLVNTQAGKRHPVHMHLVRGMILDRNGKAPLAYERGWKDVFHVGSQETVRILVKFPDRQHADLQGKYVMHCHDLQHEDDGMMSQFELGKGGLDPITTAPAKPIA